MMNPLRAKSCIVVLGNHEDRVWTKPEKYAPVLSPDSMRLMVSMATERRCILKQGNYKNAFCQGILPEDKITIVKPPIGDPEYWLLKHTLYGPRRSPRHWYTKINAALKTIGLHTNLYDPCLFTLDTSLIPPTLTSIQPYQRSPLDFTLTTSSISWKTPTLNAS